MMRATASFSDLKFDQVAVNYIATSFLATFDLRDRAAIDLGGSMIELN